jgi:hypothetical protein
MSEPIPKKLRQVKAFAKATIPLWPSSTWIPEKENSIGEKTRSLKLELSTEPGALMGKNIIKSFKTFRSGNPEEWIIWQRDFNEVCVGLDVQTGAGYIRMVRQLLSNEPLKEFERMLATFPLQTQANCNLALDAVALIIFPANAHAKQKKYVRQGLWKPKALTVRNINARISELLNDLNILSSLRNQVSNKKPKLKHASTELTVEMRHGEKLNKGRNLKALTDTGSSGCVILNEFVAGIHHKQSEGPQQWMTKGGVFKTNGICPVKFYLPEFSTQEAIKWKFHVDNSKQTAKNRCHMIIGRDLSEQLPLDIKFSDQTLPWQEVTIPMKMVDELDTQNINEIVEPCYETGHINDVTRRTMQILDASYEKADLSDIISKCTYLSKKVRTALLKLLLR